MADQVHFGSAVKLMVRVRSCLDSVLRPVNAGLTLHAPLALGCEGPDGSPVVHIFEFLRV